MNGGNITFYFKGDDTDLDKKSSGLSSKMKSVASGIGSAFVKGSAVAGGALVGLVGKSVQMAGDLEQQIGGTEAVFQDFASTVQEQSTKAFSTMGLSANDYMATMNKMGALMQGSGVDIETSMNLSSQAMQRAADVASIMGIDIEMAMESIAGAAKGNFTMMDNLGVAMNATTIEAYALSKGLNKSWNEMTKAEQVTMAMEMFLEKSAYATGNYAKENETFAGSLQTMKAAVSNFMSGAGDIDTVISSVTSFANILVTSIGEMAPKIVDGITELITGLMPKIPSLIEKLLPTVINGIIKLVQGIVGALPMIVTTLSGMLPQIITSVIQGLTSIAQALIVQLPIIIPQIITAIIEGLKLINEHFDEFLMIGLQVILAIIQGLISSIPIILQNLPTIIEAIINFFTISKMLSAGITLIKGLAKGLITGIPTLVSNIPKMIGHIVNAFKDNGVKSFKDVGINLIKGLWNGILSVKDWVLDKIKGFGSAILDGIKGFFGIHSPSTEFAWVGQMNAEGLIQGMDGMQKEVQQSFDGMFDLSPQLYGSSSMNMSPNVNLVVNNNIQQDPLGQMVSNVKTFSGGAKNDYNYGYGGN